MTTPARPFTSILVPYDGSEPSRAALAQALALLTPGVRLSVVTVVDEAPLISEAAATMVAYDPTPLFAALDDEGHAHLAEALYQCRAANETPATQIVHDTPVPGILKAAKTHACDLIIMGTHARSGAARFFLGSTTEGVLRWSDIPVLTIRSSAAVSAHPFATALVGIADSEASEAASALAESFVPAFQTHVVPMHVDGNAVGGLLDAALSCHATVMMLGSHGRRGLRGFFLGSVAEKIVRASDIPVLIVRDHPEREAATAAAAKKTYPAPYAVAV